MKEAVVIELAARRESLRDIAAFVADACARFGVEGSDCFDLRLAVEEVCANIIEHGYEGREKGALSLCFSDEGDHVVLRVGDRGTPFNPEDALMPDLTLNWEERPIGGVGLHLVRQVVDELHYDTGADGVNTLTMIKRKTRQETR